MNIPLDRLSRRVACLVPMVLFSQQIQASGFALIEQSVSGMGTAYAGGSAQANDATTVYFNPAGMTRLENAQAIAGAHIVVSQAEYHDRGSTHVAAPLGSLGTKEGSDAGGVHLVPHFYYTRPLSDDLYFGIGVNAPFGLATNYSDGWIGRYHALDSEAMSVNINPSLALKVNEKLSLGAGVSAQYFDARITNAIDFGTIDFQIVAGAGLVPGASDGDVELEGDDWSLGFNLGLLLEPTERTRLGVHYRSRIKHRLEGKADFMVPGSGAIETATGGWFVDTKVKADVELPATLSVSVVHDLDSQWSLMADVTWTEWRTMEELRFEFSTTQPDGVTTLDWENTLRFGVGLEFRPDNRWIYRGGVAYDETPIPNAAKRTPRIPGESRLWVAFGVGYRYSDSVTFDLGYAHLFVDDPKIAKTPTDEDALRGGLVGTYDASVDILSAQLVWNFD